MITIISPATTMNLNKSNNFKTSKPHFTSEIQYLISILKNLEKDEISSLMNLNDELTNLNFKRYQLLSTDSNQKLQALFAFDGQVFNSINVNDFDESDINFSNDHFRIISGLYGILKPCNIIESHRLEMKSKLKNKKGDNLYKFWKEKITSYLYNELKKQENKILLNLASNEYSKAIDFKILSKNFKVINIEFKDFKENTNSYKVIGLYSKKARGYLTRYIIKNKIDSIDDVKKFNYDGYIFNDDISNETSIIFTR